MEKDKNLETIEQELMRRQEEHASGRMHHRRVRRLVRVIIAFLAVILFCFGGFFLVNFLTLNRDLIDVHVKQKLIPSLSKGAFPLSCGNISGNLWNGVKLHNVNILNPHFKINKTLLNVPTVSLNYSPFDAIWGKLVIERVIIASPTLTLSRQADGRAIWNFATDTVDIGKKRVLLGVSDDPQERAAALADRYMRDIEIRDLSIVSPAPRELLPDRTLAKMLRLPPGNLAWPGISIKVTKKSSRDGYSDHSLEISERKRGRLAEFTWNRNRETGNFNVTISAWKQRLILGVENVGAAGRKIQLYDEGSKERMMLDFGLARPEGNILTRIIGAVGQIKIPDLAIFSWVLPIENTLKGSLFVSVSSPRKNTPLIESDFSVKIDDFFFGLLDSPPLENFSLDMSLRNRLADIRNLRLDYGKIKGIHSGTVDLLDFPAIQASFTSLLSDEPMSIFGSVGHRNDGIRHFQVKAARPAGFLETEFDQATKLGMHSYRNIKLYGKINPGKKVSDLVPARLLPPRASNRWNAWIDRIDLIGPLSVFADLPSPTEPGRATFSLDLNGAVIYSREKPEYRAELFGKALLGSNSLELVGVGVTIDSFKTEVVGKIQADDSLNAVKSYELRLDSFLKGQKPFEITGKKLQETLGLTHPPPFRSIFLEGPEGTELLRARVSSGDEPQTLQLNIPKVKLLLGKKIFWISDLNAGLMTMSRLDKCGFRPPRLTLSSSCTLFGFPINGSAQVNLASATFDKYSLTASGNDFNTLLKAFQSHPDFGNLLEKYPVSAGGNFSIDVNGYGKLNRPAVFGEVRFPSLNLKLREFNGKFPFNLSLSSTNEGKYDGKISTTNAKLDVKGVEFRLDSLQGSLSYEKPKGSRYNRLDLQMRSHVFGTNLHGNLQVIPKTEYLEKAHFKIESENIQPLVAQIVRFAALKTPFSLSGPFTADFVSSGKFNSLKKKFEVELGNLKLDLSLPTLLGQKEKISVERIKGKILLEQEKDGIFRGEVKKGEAIVLGGPLRIEGKVHLDSDKNGYIPVLDNLEASILGLPATTLKEFLSQGFISRAILGQFPEVGGVLTGKIAISGKQNRFSGTGEIAVRNGKIRHVSLPLPVENLSGSLAFSRKRLDGEPEIEIKGVTCSSGRARFSIPNGRLVGPGKTGRIDLMGVVENLFPSDLTQMLASWKIPKLTFPKEGPWQGKVIISGSVLEPSISAQVKGSSTDICFHSGSGDYTIPVGENSAGFSYDMKSKELKLEKSTLRVLNGTIEVEKGEGRFKDSGIKDFNVQGKMTGIDLGSIGTPGKSVVKGRLGGSFTATQKENGFRDALARLKFDKLVVQSLPFDKTAVDKIGISFLEEPEFTLGELNLYVSSEGENFEKGRVRVSDGLFAGPNLRLEISESDFNPRGLQLAGKLVFNPQPLRSTKLGRKLKSLTRVLQERTRGLPYVDLTVQGTWDKPEMMTAILLRQNKKRGKRNFIKSIFGGSGAHKASVEELKAWFPGWSPEK